MKDLRIVTLLWEGSINHIPEDCEKIVSDWVLIVDCYYRRLEIFDG